MGKGLRLLSALLICLIVSACNPMPPAASVVVSSPAAEERLLSDLRAQYRNAALIVSGECVGSHIDASGNTCYDLTVTKVYAGNAKAGDIVHCTTGPMATGETYLLFLGQGEDVNYSEDLTGYSLISGAPMPIVDSEVIWDGKRISLDALQKEILALSTVISAPAPVYYYDSISSLTAAADEIFIGKVTRLPQMKDTSFSIRNGGAVEKAQYSASIVTVEVYGVMKGSPSYGDELQMVFSPERIGGMLDATTLQHMELTAGQTPRLQPGGVYVFFLTKGPDAKQPYHFPVNPLQGILPLSGDTLHVPSANIPLRPYDKLSTLVQAINSVQAVMPPREDSPALVVEE
ncbi:MAG TPA: hypothetical protein VN366_13310 [Feifaniaceae bacterium]|nr:hypothetical protein [Feifaniaceae bacterium]